MPAGKTGLVVDEYFEMHDTGPGHPERPERLKAIRDSLAREGLAAQCTPIARREATDAEILAVHESGYLARLAHHCAAGAKQIDCVDSKIGPESLDVARAAAGVVLEAVDAVMAGRLTNAFCSIRPPGHHAERGLSMGFCLLSNVAIAAQYLRERHKLKRVAVVDWDVHHGNGTQHVFEETDAVFVCNIHGHPAYVYPGTGYADERGKGAGEGYTLNIPMNPGANDSDYRQAFDEQILPALDAYRPEFLLVSCGFDAHRLDPLAPLILESESYGWMTQSVTQLAAAHAGGKLVSVLEGGYNLKALEESAAIHLRELLAAAEPREVPT
jgi:acetoin utilization deacetylase AcuC-like enzyme